MVDEYLDRHVPSTTRRVDGSEELVSSQEDRRASEGSEKTGVKLGASGRNGRQKTTSSCGRRVSRDDTGGVGAAEDSCKDGVSESDDKVDDEQMGAHGDCEKSQGWWMVSPRSGDYEKSHGSDDVPRCRPTYYAMWVLLTASTISPPLHVPTQGIFATNLLQLPTFLP